MKLEEALLQTFSFVSGLGAVICLFFWVSVVFGLGEPALSGFLPLPQFTLPVISAVLISVAWRVSPKFDSTLRGVFGALLEALTGFR